MTRMLAGYCIASLACHGRLSHRALGAVRRASRMLASATRCCALSRMSSLPSLSSPLPLLASLVWVRSYLLVFISPMVSLVCSLHVVSLRCLPFFLSRPSRLGYSCLLPVRICRPEFPALYLRFGLVLQPSYTSRLLHHTERPTFGEYIAAF